MVPGPDAAAILREVFEHTGYDEERLAAALGAGDGTGFGEGDAPLHLRRLEPGAPLSALIALFAVGAPVARDDAANAFGASLDPLLAAGVLEADGARVRTRLRILPFARLLVAGDRTEPPAIPADHVPTVNRAARTLAMLTVRRPGGTAFDLGTGNGVQALLAARHADTVVASDLNARAIAFARFNAALNGLTLDLREGSWFEPVAGERFDLVVSNPPFVVSPDTALIFRDGGLRRDEVSRSVVRGAAEALNEGGFATVLCNWVHASDEDWWAPARAWIDDLPCDAWVLRGGTSDPLAYAAIWNQDLRGLDLPRYEAALDRWTTYFRDEGIASITSAAIVMRRRSAATNWARADDIEVARAPGGDQLLRMFDGVDRSASTPDLANLRFVASEGTVLEPRFAARGNALGATRLPVRTSIGLDPAIDPRVLPVLLACDATRTLAECVAATGATELAAAEDAFRLLLESGAVEIAG